VTAPAHLRARRRLADRLRGLRKATGLTGAEFADQLGWGQSKVSRFETARRLPSPADARTWATATGADPAELLDLLDRARAEYLSFRERYAAAGGAAAVQDEIGTLEAAAKRIFQWQPMLVVALVQTAAYAQELLHGPSGPASMGVSEEEIGRMVAARVRRQALIFEPGRQISLVLGEAALRTRVVSTATLRGQLEHLAHLAETLATATIGIVPFTAPIPVMPLSGFVIRDELVTIETLGGEIEIADPLEVDRYVEHIDRLLEVAATGRDAVALIQRAAAELA
jgi:transcriptional regulator with XRE-family HTH domain